MEKVFLMASNIHFNVRNAQLAKNEFLFNENISIMIRLLEKNLSKNPKIKTDSCTLQISQCEFINKIEKNRLIHVLEEYRNYNKKKWKKYKFKMSNNILNYK